MPHHLVVPSGASKTISEPMVRLAQTMHLSCTAANTVSKQKREIPLDPRHLGVPSGASKTISDIMVCSVQTVQLSCVKISTISKQTETSFHWRLVTKEHHWLRPKWFLSLSHIWRKPCTYLALTLTLFPNRPKQDSTWPTSPRSSIGCIWNNFRAYGTFGANREPILRQDYSISKWTKTSYRLSLIT